MTQMTFKEFVETVKTEMQKIYSGREVSSISVLKNNGNQYTGIIIKSGESNVVPTIYLDDFYKEYQEGFPIEDILSVIQELHQEHKIQRNLDTNSIRDFNLIKNFICYRLINAGRNCELLQTLPHRMYCDLAIVYYIPMSMKRKNDSMITIHSDLMNFWQVNEETLYKCARVNTPKLFAAHINAFSDILDGPTDRETHPDMPAFVARNSSETGGAAVLLYNNVMESFANKYGSFYILPAFTKLSFYLVRSLLTGQF